MQKWHGDRAVASRISSYQRTSQHHSSQYLSPLGCGSLRAQIPIVAQGGTPSKEVAGSSCHRGRFTLRSGIGGVPTPRVEPVSALLTRMESGSSGNATVRAAWMPTRPWLTQRAPRPANCSISSLRPAGIVRRAVPRLNLRVRRPGRAEQVTGLRLTSVQTCYKMLRFLTFESSFSVLLWRCKLLSNINLGLLVCWLRERRP